jgi:hypothetical protein
LVARLPAVPYWGGWIRFHFGTRKRQHEVAGVAKVILYGGMENVTRF